MNTGMTTGRKLLLFVGIPLLIISVIVGILMMSRDKTSDQATGTTGNTQEGTGDNQKNPGGSQGVSASTFLQDYSGKCDENAKPVFSHSPLAIDKMSHIVPMGQMMDGHVTPTDHVYIAPLNQNAADNTYDIVMPADGKIVEVGRMPAQYIGDRSEQKVAVDDFRITVSFSCKYFAIFIHAHKLGDALAKAVGDLPAGQNKQVDVSLKAGELIAKLGGAPVDLTMLDTDSQLKGFITPSLYAGERWKIHTIDPFDVYTGTLKAQLEAKSLRSVAPLAGKIDYDKAGALIGNWFQEGTNGYAGASQDRYYDGHLSIAPHHIDPAGIIYSTGNWAGKAKQLTIKGTFDPATITAASGLTKFEVIEVSMTQANGQAFSPSAQSKGMKVSTTGTVVGTVLVQVQAGEKVKVEQFPGKTADQVTAFTSAAKTYER